MAAFGSAGVVRPWVGSRLRAGLCSVPLGVSTVSLVRPPPFLPPSGCPPLRDNQFCSPSRGFTGRLHTNMDPRLQAFGKDSPAAIVRSVPVQVAHELLNAGHHYLDVRTPEEFAAGHPAGAVNVPFMYKSGGGMTRNAAFVESVTAHFNKDDEIVVGCQSGKRSMMAATELQAAEFTGITDVGGGYSAWVQGGLPVA
eukprot:TRINITY_DN2520_c0_g1_i1.p1 TRINITY_DN2520_c0_g1~~TRINITY_DN2520_c0_g1_i1.p1  ORF type:complete len:205 (-),score=17.78 TRINITY_DN2520_c0_g1_i1:136-726(-)